MSSVLNATTSRRLRGADLIVAYLEQVGVDNVFVVAGDAVDPLRLALVRNGGARPVVCRNAAEAVFMADGYVRETRKIGVCCVSAGPETTDLMTGIACAYDNEIPLLIITAQPGPLPSDARTLPDAAPIDVNVLGMFRYCTKHSALVAQVDELETKLVDALTRVLRRPRHPVHLAVAASVLRGTVAGPAPQHDLRDKIKFRATVDHDAVQLLYERLAAAQQPVMLVGSRCAEAAAIMLQFATRYRVPFTTTPGAKGLVPSDHPWYRGVFGFAGHASAAAALCGADADLVLVVGAAWNDWSGCGPAQFRDGAELIYVDADDEHVKRLPFAVSYVRGNIRAVFDRLLDRLQSGTSRQPAAAEHAGGTEALRFLADREIDATLSEAVPITPQRLMYELGRRFPPTTRYLADAGSSAAWSVHYLALSDRRKEERRVEPRKEVTAIGRRRASGGWLRVNGDFAPAGWAVAGAIGTALGNGEVPVVCITDPEGLAQNGRELAVAAAAGLNVTYVVLNDQALGERMRVPAGTSPPAPALPRCDLAAMARVMGANYAVVRAATDLATLNLAALQQQRMPTVLDVHVDPLQMPPRALAEPSA